MSASLAPLPAWQAQPGPQWEFCACPVFEIFFGGARGGGKTDAVLGEFGTHGAQYGINAVGLMLRRTYIELTETIERSRAIYTPLGAVYSERTGWRFPNGARLRFAYLDRDSDAEGYQGASFTRLYVEEIGNFPSPAPIMKLMATLRSGAGVPCGFRATGNPGGPGQGWVRSRYIDPAPGGWTVIVDPATSLERIYIPSRVGDNAYLGPDYLQRLQATGSAALVRAWVEGDWTAVEGAFFDEWSVSRHVVRPFAIPEHWARFRSMDWGSAAPFSVGWWAVATDDYSLGARDGYRVIPRGAIVRYREWYGASAPTVGLKLSADEVAAGILTKSLSDPKDKDGKPHYAYTTLDPSMFAEDGGPSIAERMLKAGLTGIKPADNKRTSKIGAMGGWDAMRARLKGDGERPMLFVFDTCIDFIRTIPGLQHDRDKPEDLDTTSEDHVADECFPGDTLVTRADGTEVPITDLRVGDKVATTRGPQPVEAVFSVGVRKVHTVTMSDGRTLTGTANHPVFVEGEGFVPLAWLRYASMLRTCATSSSSRGRGSPATPITATATSASTTGAITRRFIERSGRALTAKYRRVISSITSMVTRSTTASTTLPSWPMASTPSIIGPNGSLASCSVSIAPGHSRPALSTSIPIGSAPTPVSRRLAACRAWMTRNATASAAVRPTRSTDTRSSASALPHAPGAAPTIVSVRPAGSARVYNLTVASAEEFYANGVLVHNCRYACMSRPYIPNAPRAPPKPTELVYTANPDGSATANLSVRDIVNLRLAKKKREGR